MFTLGLISDTHGSLRAGVMKIFDGVDAIVHAGDVGNEDILVELNTLAPVTAARGNCDRGRLGESLPDTGFLRTPAGLLVVTHMPPRGTPPFPGLSPEEMPAVIVFGHTHFPKVLEYEGTLLVNPGSALQGRGAPPTVAVMRFEQGEKPAIVFYNVETCTVFPASVTHRGG